MSTAEEIERKYRKRLSSVTASFEEALRVAKETEKSGTITLGDAVMVRRASQRLRRHIPKLNGLALELREEYDRTSYRKKRAAMTNHQARKA